MCVVGRWRARASGKAPRLWRSHDPSRGSKAGRGAVRLPCGQLACSSSAPSPDSATRRGRRAPRPPHLLPERGHSKQRALRQRLDRRQQRAACQLGPLGPAGRVHQGQVHRLAGGAAQAGTSLRRTPGLRPRRTRERGLGGTAGAAGAGGPDLLAEQGTHLPLRCGCFLVGVQRAVELVRVGRELGQCCAHARAATVAHVGGCRILVERAAQRASPPGALEGAQVVDVRVAAVAARDRVGRQQGGRFGGAGGRQRLQDRGQGQAARVLERPCGQGSGAPGRCVLASGARLPCTFRAQRRT